MEALLVLSLVVGLVVVLKVRRSRRLANKPTRMLVSNDIRVGYGRQYRGGRRR